MGEGANKGTELVIIPIGEYVKLLDTKTKYNILADHIKMMLAKNDQVDHYTYANYCDGLFKAVVDYKEGAKDAEETDT